MATVTICKEFAQQIERGEVGRVGTAFDALWHTANRLGHRVFGDRLGWPLEPHGGPVRVDLKTLKQVR